MNQQLLDQMSFIAEIEKLKTVYRQNGILDGSRQENSAEHSWHIAVMAILLKPYAREELDLLKVIKMLLIHDMVEIYTGDTFLYDEQGRKEAQKTEKLAAEKLFSLLPPVQKEELLELWMEFEANQSPEAQFALVIDNLQPMLNHYYTNNQNIKGKKLARSQVIAKKSFIKDYSEDLWEFALHILDKSVDAGLYIDM